MNDGVSREILLRDKQPRRGPDRGLPKRRKYMVGSEYAAVSGRVWGFIMWTLVRRRLELN